MKYNVAGLLTRRGHMAGKVRADAKKDKILKVSFIIYIVSVAIFLVMLCESVIDAGGIFRISLRSADFMANCLRIVADIMILAGFWKTRRTPLLMWGFLLNIVPQAFDLLIHFNAMKKSMIPSIAFVATVFLIVFYTNLTRIVVTQTAKEDVFLLTKTSALVCIFFWVISDIVNLIDTGFEGAFTVFFLFIEIVQMTTLGIWSQLFTEKLRPNTDTQSN